MNLDFQSGIKLAKSIRATAKVSKNAIVVLGTPAIHLKSVADILIDHKQMHCAAQNCHEEEAGAYTGEISADMLGSIGVGYVILGHSERREIFGEGSLRIKAKVDRVLSHNLKPIFCCGESLEIRKSEQQNEYVANQIKQSLFHLDAEDFEQVVIAYEPIWAIGTGETASPAQAQDMHACIRQLVAEKYGKTMADNLSILYGGSVKPGNAKEIFGQPDVDGGLVGGASLDAQSFCAIIAAV